MNIITVRMPEDVIVDMKRIAPQLGFSGSPPLMRAYIGQGLWVDLERLKSLRRQGLRRGCLQQRDFLLLQRSYLFAKL